MTRLSLQASLLAVLLLCAVVPYYYLSYRPSQVERYNRLIEHIDQKAVREQRAIDAQLEKLTGQRVAHAGSPQAVGQLDEAIALQRRRAAYMATEIPDKRSAFEEVVLRMGGIPVPRGKPYNEAIKRLRRLGAQ